jgi:hypothetical protein
MASCLPDLTTTTTRGTVTATTAAAAAILDSTTAAEDVDCMEVDAVSTYRCRSVGACVYVLMQTIRAMTTDTLSHQMGGGV